jgi:hypothetical protein
MWIGVLYIIAFPISRGIAQNTAPTIEVSGVDTPGATNFTTYFFHVIPAEGTTITSFDGVFSTDAAGAMRQINPSGLPTVFNDFNALIISNGENPTADSQFEFNSNDGSLVVNVGESDTDLSAALVGVAPLSSRFILAHVVLSNLASGTWDIGIIQNESGRGSRTYRQVGQFGPRFDATLGDYNVNGSVDAADYVVWRRTLGQAGLGLAADGNGNQEIDAGDYVVWKSQFGQNAGESGALLIAALPEPATWLMLIGVILLAGTCGKRSRLS